MSENITVEEGDAPLITIQVKRLLPDGNYESYALTGVDEIKFVAKENPDDAEGAPGFVYTKTGGDIAITRMGDQPGDTFSELTIQFDPAHTTTPRTLYYRIIAIASSKPDTIKKGFLRIPND